MKKILVGILFLGSLAMAATEGYALQYNNAPKPGILGGQTQTLTVQDDGVVVYETFRAIPNGHTSVVIDRLDDMEMDRISDWTAEARGGKVDFIPSRAMCIRASDRNITYMGDNGTVFLKSGDICDGGFYVNEEPTAKLAVDKLNELLQKVRTMTNN